MAPPSRRLRLVAASLAVAASSRPSSTTAVLAFAPPSSPSSPSSSSGELTPLRYRAGTVEPPSSSAASAAAVVLDAPSLNDANRRSLLNDPRGRPVLVDCHSPGCGPCRLLERSLLRVLPSRSDDVAFCRWDAANDRERSSGFVEELRGRGVTFRKLPTLLLFVEGAPVAMRSGNAGPREVEAFLDAHLPKRGPGGKEGWEEECVDEVDMGGERFPCGVRG